MNASVDITIPEAFPRTGADTLFGKTICVVGLGYVGLPLADAFSRHLRTIGFRRDHEKVTELGRREGNRILPTSDASLIRQADFVCIAVPTPISETKAPDLEPVKSAAEIVGKNLKKGAIVVLESTVYPGVTEEVLRPILERASGLTCGVDFKIGYSPERVNPGDDDHCLQRITKIVSGMDTETTDALCELYSLITTVYRAPDIKTAEAAKVIENIQRDLNIALVNELSIIFGKMGLDTATVLEAAGTKWNFHRYRPGLVGGHCIPVDPYYLVYKAEQLGYHPRVILAGRTINNSMPKHVAEMTIKGLNASDKVIKGSKILIMGMTYKEDVADTRESPVEQIVKELKDYSCDVYGYDPMIPDTAIDLFGAKPLPNLDVKMDAVIITVAHKEFTEMSMDAICRLMRDNPVVIDVRGILACHASERTGLYYRRL